MCLLQFFKVCAQKICFVEHFTRSHLYLERRVWNVCKNISGRNVYARSKFSSVRSPRDLCAHMHEHSLEGTLPVTRSWIQRLMSLASANTDNDECNIIGQQCKERFSSAGHTVYQDNTCASLWETILPSTEDGVDRFIHSVAFPHSSGAGRHFHHP